VSLVTVAAPVVATGFPGPFTVIFPVIFGWTEQTKLNSPACAKLHDPLQLELLESMGTPEQLGVIGGLCQVMPCGIPVELLNSTDSPGLISAVEGFQEELPTASIVGEAARLGTTVLAISPSASKAAIGRWRLRAERPAVVRRSDTEDDFPGEFQPVALGRDEDRLHGQSKAPAATQSAQSRACERDLEGDAPRSERRADESPDPRPAASPAAEKRGPRREHVHSETCTGAGLRKADGAANAAAALDLVELQGL
jgi:hypothetical protein